MFPEEVWFNIKHYDLSYESFEKFLKEYEKDLRVKWNLPPDEDSNE